MLIKSATKEVQSVGALILAKAVQSTRMELLYDTIEGVLDKIIFCLKSPSLRATSTLLESLILIIFHIEEEFGPFLRVFIPTLLDLVTTHADWNTQKVAIDALNAISTTLPDEVLSYRVPILQALKKIRTHKTKPVRDAAGWTIKLLKEL